MISIYGSLVILSFVNPIALDRLGWRYFIVFCVLLVFILATTWFLFPETKGHSLEEIAEIFDGPGYRSRVSDGVWKDDAMTIDTDKRTDAEHIDKVA